MFSVAISHDATRVVTGGGDSRARLGRNDGGLERTLFGHAAVVTAVAFSPDGATFLTGPWDRAVILWDTATGSIEQDFIGHLSFILSVAYSADATRILTASPDDTARLWAVVSADELRFFSGHAGDVTAAVFSPEENIVLTGSTDGTAKLWNLNRENVIGTFFGHTGAVNDVDFSPDGLLVLTGSDDDTAVLWPLGAAEGEGEGPCALAYSVPEADRDGDGILDCEECALGSDANNVDTDGDGLADGFEFEFGLDLLTDDADLDADGDGLTNLEEFLAGSDPSDVGSPNSTFFVATTGTDSAASGTREAPWATINFALSQVIASAANPVRINVIEGVYTENFALIPWMTIAAALDAAVTIEGAILAANDARLIALELTKTSAVAAILDMDNARMELLGVVFRGSAGRDATGIVVRGPAPVDSLIEDCTFTSLAVGIDIIGTVPVIRRCLFEDLSTDGIIVRRTADLTGRSLGVSAIAASGFNVFDTPTIDGFAVRNEQDEILIMENNEWGTDDELLIEESISGPNDFDPFLAQGAAILASAIFVRVIDAPTQTPITNCTVKLDPSVFDPVTENVDGLYIYPAVIEGPYTITVTAPGLGEIAEEVTLGGGEALIVTIAMGIPDFPDSGDRGDPGDPGDPGTPNTGCYRTGNTQMDSGLSENLILGLLVAAALAFFVRRRHSPPQV